MDGVTAVLSAEQLKVVEEALSDAYAYRFGEEASQLDDLDDEDREPCERYLALADQLGLRVQ